MTSNVAAKNPNTPGSQQNQTKNKNKGSDGNYLNRIWQRDKDPLPLNSQEFQFKVIRPDRTDFDIGPLIESAEWRDEGTFDNINSIPVLRGTISMRRPAPDDPHHGEVVIHDGYRLKCKVRWGGDWREIWEMRIQQSTIDIADGSWSFECADDLNLLSKSIYNYKFNANDHDHKKGWRYWEIVRNVCHHANIPFDHKMPKGGKWITKFSQTRISPLECIRQVVQQEIDYSGKQMTIAWRNGKLTIRHLRRNPLLFTLADQLRDANIVTTRGGKIATSLQAHAHQKVKKNGSTKKVPINVHIVDKDVVKKYGFIHIEHNFGEVNDHEQLKSLAKRYYAKNLKAVRKVTGISHYGIAYVRRGDAIQFHWPQEGYTGERSFLFVYSITHTLSGGDYTMSTDVTKIDPLDPQKLKAQREAAQRRRKHAQNRSNNGSGNN